MKDNDLIFGLMVSFHKEAFSFHDLRCLTAPFNVSESSLRTSLSRMSAAGLIQVTRNGRSAYYGFGEKGLRIRSNVSRGFGIPDWDGWDRSYWGVAFSVPDQYAEKRHYIRKKLTLYRFACLNPGLWIRPAHAEEHIPEILRNILLSGFCRLIKFRNYTEFTADEISAMWNLSGVNHRFSMGLSLLELNEKKLKTLSPSQALEKKMTVGEKIVNIIFDDPLLPPQFQPPDWHGDAIREQFQRFDRLATERSKPFWEAIYLKEDVL